jgi:hypothetical protein
MTSEVTPKSPSILLIDDNEELLDTLHAELADVLTGESVDIRRWVPTAADGSPDDVFQSKVDDTTVLVVTDYDLTSGGKTGLFGLSIVGWCQTRAIPVGDFSRKIPGLPSGPNLFELRVPTGADEAAAFIASIYRGFKHIREEIVARPDLVAKRSLALVLADLLGRPNLESEFALYISWLSAANSGLLDKLRAAAPPAGAPTSAEKNSLLTYILGHVLLNAILKYAGPILSEEAFCAYLATTSDQIDNVASLFKSALYDGPFSGIRRYFWREAVDPVIDELARSVEDQQFDTFGELNRRAVELALGQALPRHACDRCAGQNGVFLPIYPSARLPTIRLLRRCKQLDPSRCPALSS